MTNTPPHYRYNGGLPFSPQELSESIARFIDSGLSATEKHELSNATPEQRTPASGSFRAERSRRSSRSSMGSRTPPMQATPPSCMRASEQGVTGSPHLQTRAALALVAPPRPSSGSVGPVPTQVVGGSAQARSSTPPPSLSGAAAGIVSNPVVMPRTPPQPWRPVPPSLCRQAPAQPNPSQSEVSAHEMSAAASGALNGSISCLGASTSCLDAKTLCLDTSTSCLADQRKDGIPGDHKAMIASSARVDAKVDKLLLDAEAMERRIKDLMRRCKVHDSMLDNSCSTSVLHESQLVGRCR